MPNMWSWDPVEKEPQCFGVKFINAISFTMCNKVVYYLSFSIDGGSSRATSDSYFWTLWRKNRNCGLLTYSTYCNFSLRNQHLQTRWHSMRMSLWRFGLHYISLLSKYCWTRCAALWPLISAACTLPMCSGSVASPAKISLPSHSEDAKASTWRSIVPSWNELYDPIV